MIIRCPQCEHTRSINENKIPPTAELASCPKCKHRFRFRTLRPILDPQPDGNGRQNGTRQAFTPPSSAITPASPSRNIIRPQSAIRESAGQTDVWDAVDALNRLWQTQLDQHVTEVKNPALSEKSEQATGSRQSKSSQAGQGKTIAASSSATYTGPTGSEESVLPEESPAGGKSASLSAERTPLEPNRQAPSVGSPSLPQEPDKTFVQADLPLFAAVAQSETGSETAITQEWVKGIDATNPYASDAANEPGEPDKSDADKNEQIALPNPNVAIKPEERVERDLRLLCREPDQRPTRYLGRLSEFPNNVKETEEAPSLEISWENPAKYGWVASFMRTVREVMFDAPVFFSNLPVDGSLAPGYLFFLALGYISIIATVAWMQVASLFLPGLFALPKTLAALPLLLLLAPIALGLMLLFVTGLIRVVIRFFAPEKAIFHVIYRVVSYSVAPFILSLVPFVGPGLGALWFLASLMLGCRHALALSWPLTLTAPLLPAITLLGGIIWYFL